MKKRKSKFTVGDFELHVRRSRTGRGLFTESAIPRGSCIIEYTGRRISKSAEERDTGKYLFDTGAGTIDGNTPKNTARYINHSCAPNCEADGPRGNVFILAKRAIKPGEELTYDYGEEYFDRHIGPKGCLCNACKHK